MSFKVWAIKTFLPRYINESVRQENEKLRRRIGSLEQELREANAYADGLETALRAVRKITIHNEVVK